MGETVKQIRGRIMLTEEVQKYVGTVTRSVGTQPIVHIIIIDLEKVPR
jgi:hypothetical protein